MILFLDECSDILPILRLVRKGVIPLIQIGIIAALVVLLIIDFGKAVMAGKEDEIKSAQKLAIKRVVYALVVFLVPFIVNTALGLLVHANDAEGNPEAQEVSALGCWDKAK